MRNLILSVSVIALFLASCKDNKENKKGDSWHWDHRKATDSSANTFIPVDSANKMIESYLSSIDYKQNDSDLHCLIVNGDSLRAYLNQHQEIHNMKLMLAHTLDYINNGGGNKNAGYQINALTIILVGYDSMGNYVYMNIANKNMVMDHSMPCPYSCPPSGNAQSNIITVNNDRR